MIAVRHGNESKSAQEYRYAEPWNDLGIASPLRCGCLQTAYQRCSHTLSMRSRSNAFVNITR